MPDQQGDAPVDADDGQRSPGFGPTPDDPTATILSSGDPFRSFLELPDALVDEVKLRFKDDGVHVTVVDPANVGMLDVTFPDTGFDNYRYTPSGADTDALDVTVVGVNVGYLTDAVARARKRQDDPIRVDVIDARSATRGQVRAAVNRADQGMRLTSQFYCIDPDSIRKEPDVPTLDLSYKARVDVDALQDAFDAIDANHDHADLRVTDADEFAIEATHSDDVEDKVVFPDAVEDAGDSHARGDGSAYSLDYLQDMVAALDDAKIDRVTLRFGDEFPLKMAFTHPDWGFTGEYMLAPRIRSE